MMPTNRVPDVPILGQGFRRTQIQPQIHVISTGAKPSGETPVFLRRMHRAGYPFVTRPHRGIDALPNPLNSRLMYC